MRVLRSPDLVSVPAHKAAVVAAANRTASVAEAETGQSQNHLMAHRDSTAALAAELVSIEIAQRLVLRTAASNHRPAEVAAPKEWSAEARRLWPASPQSAWCRPEYKRPASLPQKFGCKLGSVS